jgi:hypothetical protein
LKDNVYSIFKEPKEKSENNDLVIKAKLSVREKEIELLRQKDSMNTDAISALSDQLSTILQEIELLKRERSHPA